jgi:2-amino-4-hydroxy-6-hydroxymethyldihydropteridine diphosphokinase
MRRSTTDGGAPVLAGIGLGANLGDACATLDAALRALAALPDSTLRAASSIYRSAPVDSSGPDYLNAVALIDTQLTPHALLGELQRIEREHGRERPYHNAPRTLDLDLLFLGDRRIRSSRLTVPHPRLHERAFVLRPLAEVAPTLVIPSRGCVADLLAGVADQRADKLIR